MGSGSVEEEGNVCFAAAMFQVSWTVFYNSFRRMLIHCSYSYNPDANMGALGFGGMAA